MKHALDLQLALGTCLWLALTAPPLAGAAPASVPTHISIVNG